MSEKNWHANPIWKWGHIALILIIVNELLILVTRDFSISFMVANFIAYEKVLIKRCYTSEGLSSFSNFSKFSRTSWKK